jgi:hypothetical protein
MEVVHGIMKLAYLYSDAFSMLSRELEQLYFGTGEFVIEEAIMYFPQIQIFIGLPLWFSGQSPWL